MVQVSTTSAKDNLTVWFIITIIAFFLWYRNQEYDRVMAMLIFTFGLFCLISYGVYNTMNLRQASDVFAIIAWLQTAVISLSVWIYLRSKNVSSDTELFLAVFFSVVFIISIILAVTGNIGQSLKLDKDGLITWNTSLTWMLLYLLGILAPLIILASHKSDPGVFIIFFYLLASFALLSENAPAPVSYLLVGLSFLAYMIGAFY